MLLYVSNIYFIPIHSFIVYSDHKLLYNIVQYHYNELKQKFKKITATHKLTLDDF